MSVFVCVVNNFLAFISNGFLHFAACTAEVSGGFCVWLGFLLILNGTVKLFDFYHAAVAAYFGLPYMMRHLWSKTDLLWSSTYQTFEPNVMSIVNASSNNLPAFNNLWPFAPNQAWLWDSLKAISLTCEQLSFAMTFFSICGYYHLSCDMNTCGMVTPQAIEECVCMRVHNVCDCVIYWRKVASNEFYFSFSVSSSCKRWMSTNYTEPCPFNTHTTYRHNSSIKNRKSTTITMTRENTRKLIGNNWREKKTTTAKDMKQ